MKRCEVRQPDARNNKGKGEKKHKVCILLFRGQTIETAKLLGRRTYILAQTSVEVVFKEKDYCSA